MNEDIARLDRELGEQRKTVTDQGQLLAVVVSALSEIKAYMKESIEVQKEQAVMFEKFANHEEQNNGAHTHLHDRIDALVIDIKEMKKSHASACAIVQPMAEKGARLHSGMVTIAKGLAASVGLMLLYLIVWAIKKSDYTP